MSDDDDTEIHSSFHSFYCGSSSSSISSFSDREDERTAERSTAVAYRSEESKNTYAIQIILGFLALLTT